MRSRTNCRAKTADYSRPASRSSIARCVRSTTSGPLSACLLVIPLRRDQFSQYLPERLPLCLTQRREDIVIARLRDRRGACVCLLALGSQCNDHTPSVRRARRLLDQALSFEYVRAAACLTAIEIRCLAKIRYRKRAERTHA